MSKISENGIIRDATAEETTQIDADRAANPTSAEKKLAP